jgi:hypothetical protein
MAGGRGLHGVASIGLGLVLGKGVVVGGLESGMLRLFFLSFVSFVLFCFVLFF